MFYTRVPEIWVLQHPSTRMSGISTLDYYSGIGRYEGIHTDHVIYIPGPTALVTTGIHRYIIN